MPGKKCPALHSFTGCDVPWLLDQQSRARPDKTFLVGHPIEEKTRQLTFAQFNEETKAFATGFASN